ncbi:MAG: acyltransferase [Duncaniella sp.]|nr:acyltransferase [Duncaniella sp.]
MKDKSEDALLAIFDWLRFPLIIGVIFIHNHSVKTVECVTDSYGGYLVELFSQGIGRLSVPMFFFISGYLFFYRVDTFDRSVYAKKLKGRVKSLLAPYLIWNFLILSAYLALYSLGLEKTKIDSGFGFASAVKAFVCPLAYQMWFVRDLFCVVLVSPLIFCLVSRFRVLYICAISVLWILGLEIPVLGTYCLSMTSIFFFSFGAAFSVAGLNVLVVAEKVKIMAFLYPALLILDLFSKSAILHNIAILSGLFLIFLTCGYMAESGRLKPMPFLASSSFFIFAVHEPFLLTINRKILLSLNDSDSLYVTFSYFLAVGLTVAISLGIYSLLSRFAPGLTALLTGGRRQRAASCSTPDFYGRRGS